MCLGIVAALKITAERVYLDDGPAEEADFFALQAQVAALVDVDCTPHLGETPECVLPAEVVIDQRPAPADVIQE